eukprot:scaffold28872_cov55-Phaeocystis_antarctica.AAC.4
MSSRSCMKSFAGPSRSAARPPHAPPCSRSQASDVATASAAAGPVGVTGTKMPSTTLTGVECLRP